MRRSFLVLSFLFAIIAVAIQSTSGFTTRLVGLRVSAHSWEPSAVAAGAAAIAWMLLARRHHSVRLDLIEVDRWLEARAAWLVAAIAVLSGAIAVRFNTFSASGADPSGYLSEAAMLGAGALRYTEPLAATAGWPHAAETLAPLGWLASGDAAQVPTYPVGLPLLMIVPHALAGTLGATLVVCASASVTVWCAGRLAHAIAGGAAGVFAAVWVATMPILIYESIQPMSDVPVTAAWLVCWWMLGPARDTRQAGGDPKNPKKGTGPFSRRATALAGIATGIAVLIRPNLAPLAAVPALFLIAQTRRVRDVIAFSVPVAVAGVVIAVLHWQWFGSPLRSGYGTASEIYSLGYVSPNARLYWQWLVDTHGPLLVVAPLAVAVSSRMPIVRWMLVFALLVCGAYLIYAVFESWPYLRFLLPALVIAAIAVATLLGALVAQRPAARAPIVIAVTLAVAAFQLTKARDLSIFGMEQRQRRAALAGHYLASALNPQAILVAGEQSGAMRYYTHHAILRWDFMDAAAFAQARLELAASGRAVWIVLDDWEVALFRDRFPDLSLDWPARLDAGVEGRTQAWRLADRAGFVTGGRVITDRLR